MPTDQLPSPFILTADIGGSHITVGICNLHTESIIPGSLSRVEVASKGAADMILSAWTSALQTGLKVNELPISGVSIAMPGPFDYENGIAYIKGLNKYEAIYGMNIKQYLSAALDIAPQLIRFRNDAESTIAGEALAGAGKNCNTVLGVTLGTGFGSAFSQFNVTADLNFGSEPYRDSIADDYFSTRWFLKRYHQLSGKTLTGGVKELAALAADDKTARDIFVEFADGMSYFLSKPVRQLQPEILVLCGNISKASTLFLPRLMQNLNSTTIVLAQLGESAPLIGAAAVFKNPEQ